jgi:hypothetical protein
MVHASLGAGAGDWKRFGPFVMQPFAADASSLLCVSTARATDAQRSISTAVRETQKSRSSRRPDRLIFL